MYKFKLPIGDWSDDGHGKFVDYLIESNKPIEEVRELYFKAKEKLGYGLEGHDNKTPCAKYQDSEFSFEVINDLDNIGVKNLDFYFENQDGYDMDTKSFCNIVLNFIMSQDLELILKIIPDDDIPMFQFYGFDEKKRHIGHFGYGLFD